MKKFLSISMASFGIFAIQQSAVAYDFFQAKPVTHKYSISAGWLHAAPTGDANPMRNTTIIADGTVSKNGAVRTRDVIDAIDITDSASVSNKSLLESLEPSLPTLPPELSGTTTINGISRWTSPGTGLEANNVDTLGLLFDYHINDKWTAEFKAGIPPKVDIKGKGTVYTPFTGIASTPIGNPHLIKDIKITDMSQGNGIASSARAWLPAAELQYHFDPIRNTKIRPYVGGGVMYAYFDQVKVAKGIEKDLKVAGQRIQMIKDGQAGGALADIIADNDTMKVNAKADNALAPLVTVGATYDINDKWYAVGSLSYAKLNNDTTITVTNKASGENVIKSKTKIDIDPFITYLGFGYRF